MFIGLMRQLLKRRSQPTAKVRPQIHARPQLEALEGRWAPAAVRNIPGTTANNLGPQDDSPSLTANVGFQLNFFGLKSSSVFVNNNGNITFGQAFSTFTPTALNTNNGGVPIIAAFFADVDTRGAASGVTSFGTGTLCGLKVFAVNWVNVGYFASNTNKLNSFQLVLINRADTGVGNFDIEFNYDQVQWETGDASGGTNGLGGQSVHVGYTNGTGNAGTFFELPGSGINGALIDGGPQALTADTRAASTPGRYHFFVRNGKVTSAINTEVTSAIRVHYPLRYSSRNGILSGEVTLTNIGGTPQSSHPCLDETGVNVVNTDGSFQGPITVVFTGLPGYIQVANRTARTKSGKAYITIGTGSLPLNVPFRVYVRLSSPIMRLPSNFWFGYSIRVFAGTFDRTAL